MDKSRLLKLIKEMSKERKLHKADKTPFESKEPKDAGWAREMQRNFDPANKDDKDQTYVEAGAERPEWFKRLRSHFSNRKIKDFAK